MKRLIRQLPFSRRFFFALAPICCFSLGRTPAAQAAFYTQNVAEERQEQRKEVFLFQGQPPSELTLRDKIFNAELSTEFRQRYIDKFGTLDTESVVYQENNFDYDPNFSQSPVVQEDYDKRKSFAEYVGRRLTEWHFDHYFKSEPNLRPVYETKERLSHVEVKVRQTTFKSTYNFSSNIVDVIAEGGYVDVRYSLEMNPRSIGPSSTQEQKIILSRELSPTWSVKNTNTMVDGISALEFVERFRYSAAMSYLAQTYFNSDGTTTREGRFVVGYSKAF